MIYKKDLQDYEFETIEDYFEYIIDSIINGNRSQAKKLILNLSWSQRFDYLIWVDESISSSLLRDDDDYMRFSLEALKDSVS